MTKFKWKKNPKTNQRHYLQYYTIALLLVYYSSKLFILFTVPGVSFQQLSHVLLFQTKTFEKTFGKFHFRYYRKTKIKRRRGGCRSKDDVIGSLSGTFRGCWGFIQWKVVVSLASTCFDGGHGRSSPGGQSFYRFHTWKRDKMCFHQQVFCCTIKFLSPPLLEWWTDHHRHVVLCDGRLPTKPQSKDRW